MISQSAPRFLRKGYREKIVIQNELTDTDFQKIVKESVSALNRNERNNGREDVYAILREMSGERIYFDITEDTIQQIKIRLKGK